MEYRCSSCGELLGVGVRALLVLGPLGWRCPRCGRALSRVVRVEAERVGEG